MYIGRVAEPTTLGYATPKAKEVPGTGFFCAIAGWAAGGALLSGLGAMLFGEALLVVALVLGVTAIMAGILGLTETVRLQKPRLPVAASGRGGMELAVAGIILGGLALAGVIALPSMNRAACGSTRIKCGSNLRQIGQALRQYAIDDIRHGLFPPSMDVLVAESDLVPEVLTCPLSGTQSGPPPFVVGKNCDYRYLGAGLADTLPPGVVLGTCDPTHHDNEGANVLFGDGSVRWLTTSELLDALTESRELLLNP